MDIPQSTWIVGAVLAMFLVFITVKGELPKYMGFLFGNTTSSPTGS